MRSVIVTHSYGIIADRAFWGKWRDWFYSLGFRLEKKVLLD